MKKLTKTSKFMWKYLEIRRAIYRVIADTIGNWLFWKIIKLPYFKAGEKIMGFVVRYETLDPYENK